jgi:CheY-like chemotaxis protein
MSLADEVRLVGRSKIQQRKVVMAIMAAGNAVVLIVEDHDDTREMLQLLLGLYGCRVLAAANGDDAISLAEKTLPDLILMDMKMPRLDGLSITRMIRSHPTLSKVPIVAMTGMVTPQFHLEAVNAGCDDCLEKPIDFDRLEKLVKERGAIATLSC